MPPSPTTILLTRSMVTGSVGTLLTAAQYRLRLMYSTPKKRGGTRTLYDVIVSSSRVCRDLVPLVNAFAEIHNHTYTQLLTLSLLIVDILRVIPMHTS